MSTRVGHLARFGLFSIWIFLCAAATAVAAPYAAMVMDARSGEVLHARNADTRLHPASLTKMMTLYVVFQAVERGEISLDKKIKISKKAAAEPPSKLGLKPGQRIALRYLIRAAAVKSANDAATALAEAISGSEAAFARRMNRTAKALGMTRTSYVWRPAFEDNHAVPHDEYGRARRLSRRREADAAGSMFTTAGDYARFVSGLLAAQDQRRETVDGMWSLQVPIDSVAMFGPGARETTRANDELRLGWSLGWGRFETKHGPAVFHTGHDFGWQNYTVTHLYPGTGVVLLSNSNNFESVARELVAAALGEERSPFDWLGYPHFDPKALREPPPDPVVVDVAVETLRDYVGDYSYMGDRVITFRLEGGSLFASTGDDEWDELAATSTTELFIPGSEASFRFVPSPGRPPRLVILVDGLEISAQPLAEALDIPEDTLP